MPFFNVTKDNEIDIFDEIIGWDMQSGEFKRALDSVLKKKGQVVINLNSPGGVVTEGMAMYGLLRPIADKVVVNVYGVAASIASVIAMAAGKVRMMEGSMMMIHDPFIAGFISGGAEEMQSLADVLSKMREMIKDAYHKKTNISHDEIAEMMSAETWLTAEEAVEKGFADEAIATHRAAARFEFPSAKNKEGVKKYLTAVADSASPSEKEGEAETPSIEAILNEILEIVRDLKERDEKTTEPAEPVDSSSPETESDSGTDFLSLLEQATLALKSNTKQEV